MEVCQDQPCLAYVHIKGNLNGHPLRAEVLANLSGSRLAAGSNLSDETSWFPYAPVLLAPVAWSSAAQKEKAANGYSLTRGRFQSQAQITFVSG